MIAEFECLLSFKENLENKIRFLDESQLKRLHSRKFQKLFKKVCSIDFHLSFNTICSQYSNRGRPAIDPGIIFRSFILMMELGFTSLHKWVEELNSDRLLQILIGTSNPPAVATHYNFINRFTNTDSHKDDLHPKDYNRKSSNKSLKKGEKLENFTKEDTLALYDKYKEDAVKDRSRMAYVMQRLMTELVVIPSSDMDYINDKNLILSGDGSALHINVNPYGHAVKEDSENDHNTHRFSAPDADFG